MKRISIVVPIYNAEKTISRCIDSIINQTFYDIEIILIDDGSEDNSRVICEGYAAQDNRIIFIHNANGGVSKARNTGIERVTTDYLMFVDSDDYIEPNMCEVLFNAVDNTEYEVAMGGYRRDFVFNGGVTKSVLTVPNVQSVESIEQFVKCWSGLYEKSLFNAPWGKLYKMNYIKNNGIKFKEDLNCGEDLLFNLEVFRYVNKIALVNEAYYVYESSEKESLTTKYNAEKYINDRFLYNITLEYLKKMDMINVCKHSAALIYMRSCFRTFEQMIFSNNGLNSEELRDFMINIISCDETEDAVFTSGNINIEKLIYSMVLKTKSHIVISMFTKIRFNYKKLYRKGWKY
jgi:glycosyltransferase involved in cell wall biosynthesis